MKYARYFLDADFTTDKTRARAVHTLMAAVFRGLGVRVWGIDMGQAVQVFPCIFVRPQADTETVEMLTAAIKQLLEQLSITAQVDVVEV